MVEAVLRARGPYSLRLTAGSDEWTSLLCEGRWASARQQHDGHVVVRASCEQGVEDARFMLALDDDTSEFHRRFGHDPLIGPTVRRLRGMRTRRKATVTQQRSVGSADNSSRRVVRSRSSARSSVRAVKTP
jgi:hypothetical protein